MTAKCISLDFYHTLMDGCDFPVCLGNFSSSFISCGLPWSTAVRLLLFKFFTTRSTYQEKLCYSLTLLMTHSYVYLTADDLS